MGGRRGRRARRDSGIHLPMLAPPAAQDAAARDWYRVASDVMDLKGKYEEEEEEAELESETSFTEQGRQQWSNQVEFLMSCIATSVGLGNVWRFAFAAYQNGGGAFLIPYLVVLVLVGKPMYYLECLLGQFSSRNSVRVWSCAPGMKGTGYAQTICILYILSYYVSIVALCLHYLVASFRSPLPWAACRAEWPRCVPSAAAHAVNLTARAASSAELYFIHTVLQQTNGIDNGLGAPVWYLVVCLLAAWLIIFLIVAQGVKSSGKAAYFLALFPYVVMIILFVSTMLLPGAGKGILFFVTPRWRRLLDLDVWYAAVTQVFFSLTVGTGPIIMFSSYNNFRANVHRDSLIVTSLDTLTSLLSGATIFGILGNLAHVLRADLPAVVGSGGTGLAFISYPDAIAKTFMPQVFAVLFFVMMVVLGIGSSVAFLSTINTVCLDALPRVRAVYVTLLNCCLGFLAGLVYLTPGGQYVLELVDYYGATFLALFCAICEIIGVIWIYGLEEVCLDVEFMLGLRTSLYWRACWALCTPALMLLVFVYALVNTRALLYAGHYVYPTLAYVAGYVLLFAGIVWVPLFMCVLVHRQKSGTYCERFKSIFMPKLTWGPRDRKHRKRWEEFKRKARQHQSTVTTSKLKHFYLVLTGGYRKGVEREESSSDDEKSLEIDKTKNKQNKSHDRSKNKKGKSDSTEKSKNSDKKKGRSEVSGPANEEQNPFHRWAPEVPHPSRSWDRSPFHARRPPPDHSPADHAPPPADDPSPADQNDTSNSSSRGKKNQQSDHEDRRDDDDAGPSSRH